MRLCPPVLAALAIVLLATPAWADVVGPAGVIDGDTLQIAGQRIRLYAIDAPESGQTCTRRGIPWECGTAATALLTELTAGQQIACVETSRDATGVIEAKCKADWLDLGAEMVTRGLALPDLQRSLVYLPNYREARGKGNGIFAGQFVPPEEWRNGKRLQESGPSK